MPSYTGSTLSIHNTRKRSIFFFLYPNESLHCNFVLRNNLYPTCTPCQRLLSCAKPCAEAVNFVPRAPAASKINSENQNSAQQACFTVASAAWSVSTSTRFAKHIKCNTDASLHLFTTAVTRKLECALICIFSNKQDRLHGTTMIGSTSCCKSEKIVALES